MAKVAKRRDSSQRDTIRREPTPGSSRSTVVYSPSQGSRTIFGLMAVAVTFALVGHEVKMFSGQEKSTLTHNPLGTGVRIITGGFLGTAVLIVISKAGDPGRKFAVGAAVIVLITSTVVYGGPVWDALNKMLGSKPTQPLGTATKTGGASSPTGQTSTTTTTKGTGQ